MLDLLIYTYTEEMPYGEQDVTIYEKYADILMIICKEFGINISENDITLQTSYLRLILGVKLPQDIVIPAKSIKGPKVNAQQVAIDGFLTKYHAKKEDLVVKNDYFYYEVSEKSCKLNDIINNIIQQCFSSWQSIWNETTIWSDEYKWPRPIRQIFATLNGKLLEPVIKNADFSNEIAGNKFVFPIKTQPVNTLNDVSDFLSKSNILLDQILPFQDFKRKNCIINEIQTKQNTIYLQELNSAQLKIINKINTLCESVSVIYGNLPSNSHNLPDNVIIAILVNHLSFIPFFKNSKFSGDFAVVIDKPSLTDNQKNSILHGNDKVFNARIYDAMFFYNQDKSQKIEYFIERINNITFHSKLGSIYDITRRVKFLYLNLKNKLNFSISQECFDEIADHYKLDLASSMIGEFPELQGEMNIEYFTLKNQEIFNNISVYQYKTINDVRTADLSRTELEILLILWLEYSISLLSVDEKPTSSKDPFGIRRRLKYVFELAEMLKIGNFDEILKDLIKEYGIFTNIDTKNVYNELLKHKI